MPPTQYSPKVDRHIYGISGGCESVQDWIELACAAADQAGFSTDPVKSIRKGLEVLAETEGLEDPKPARKAKE